MEMKNILTLDEACEFCGLQRSYMYRLTSTRQIPHFKPRAKLIYFHRSELENWLLQNRVETVAESEAKAIDHCKNGGVRK